MPSAQARASVIDKHTNRDVMETLAQVGAALVNMSGKSLEEGKTIHPYDLVPFLRPTQGTKQFETNQQRLERERQMIADIESGKKKSSDFESSNLPMRI